MNYTNWYWGEPNEHRAGKVCMELASAKNYRWADYNCTVPRCSVCELDL